MMPTYKYILAHLTFLSLVTCMALPAKSQSAETETAQLAVESGGHPTDTSPPVWASPSDLIQDKTITISPARSGGTDILSCPFEALRAAYLSLYDDTDALNVAALESEIFKVCIERQKQVKQLLDYEARLRIQLGDVVSASINTQTQIIVAPTKPKIAEENQGTPTITTQAPEPPAEFREAKSAELNQPELLQFADRYTSGPIFGSVTLDGGLHAVVYDATLGTEHSVKADDPLPGGVTVQRISIDDGVIISEQGVNRPLARTLKAPTFDDGGGLLFKTVPMADSYKLGSPKGSTSDTTWETLK